MENGRLLTPEGIEYRVLWLPDNCRMLPETLERILGFLREGATVVGDAPEGLATLNGGKEAQRRFDRAVRTIWGRGQAGVRRVGRGRVISGLPVEKALAAAGIAPDLRGRCAVGAPPDGRGRLVFRLSAARRRILRMLDFRCAGDVELWDPATGRRTRLAAKTAEGRTRVELELPQSGSCYVVFRPESDLPLPETAAGTTVERELDDWTLRFPAGWGAPGRMELTELLPWRALRMPDEGRAFSGTAVYETTFDLREPLKSLHARSGTGRDDRRRDGERPAGADALGAAPYRTEIAEYLREGETGCGSRSRARGSTGWFTTPDAIPGSGRRG